MCTSVRLWLLILDELTKEDAVKLTLKLRIETLKLIIDNTGQQQNLTFRSDTFVSKQTFSCKGDDTRSLVPFSVHKIVYVLYFSYSSS